MDNAKSQKARRKENAAAQDWLNEAKLRASIRRLKDANVLLTMTERTTLASILERVLTSPAEARWMAAIRNQKGGAPRKTATVDHYEEGTRIAGLVAGYITKGLTLDDAIATVTSDEGINEYRSHKVRNAWDAFGPLVQPGRKRGRPNKKIGVS